MKSRIISALLMVLIIVPIFYYGGLSFKIGIALLSILAFKELTDLKKYLVIPKGMKIVGALVMLFFMFLADCYALSYINVAMVFLVLFAPTVFLTKYDYKVSEALYLSAITLFLGVIFNLFISLFVANKLALIYVLIVACATDVFALFGGKLIGRHKFTKISPNKTIEGCIVGTIVSVSLSTTYYLMFISDAHFYRIILMGLILSIMGQIGDLFFSLIKRENNIKDFSNIIPGHGGILDRIDSIIFIIISYVFIMQFI